MGKIPSRGSDQFVLRFPPGLRDQIRDIAEKNGRSMNAEIIARLMESLETEAMLNDPDPTAAFQAMMPIMEMAKEEIAKRYDDRLTKMESVLGDLSRVIRDGAANKTDLEKLANAIDTGIARRRSKQAKSAE